jgi:recombination protein RecT
MNSPAKTAVTKTAPAQSLSSEIAVLQPEVAKVLPPHVSPEKFMRVVMTAIASSPELGKADRRSLLTSAIKCAQDGLLPDGREAAFVVFKTKDKASGNFVQKVQYMPMVYGILKKVRNSGELLSLTCNVVAEHDDFRYWIDDAGEHVTHEPNVTVADRGKLRAVYAIAKTRDGGVYTEVMSLGQIEQVRAVSKAKDAGPWVEWYGEMARKTVIRRLSKRLPMSTDIERVIQRVDEQYSMQEHQRIERSGVEATRAVLGLSDAFNAAPSDPVPDDHDEPAEPAFTEASAADAIATTTSIDELKALWIDIAGFFIDTTNGIPIALEAKYGDRLEALKAGGTN